ncbi:MAG: hypothetical protein AMJ84_09720 [Acidithiobacillales bacterium SM23_46]|nr:MAG: hypothetical protein AMJ84_09720 [Acidithiobacillales bacterium SM23_46]
MVWQQGPDVVIQRSVTRKPVDFAVVVAPGFNECQRLFVPWKGVFFRYQARLRCAYCSASRCAECMEIDASQSSSIIEYDGLVTIIDNQYPSAAKFLGMCPKGIKPVQLMQERVHNVAVASRGIVRIQQITE